MCNKMCFLKETVIAFNLSKPKHKEGLCIHLILNHLKLSCTAIMRNNSVSYYWAIVNCFALIFSSLSYLQYVEKSRPCGYFAILRLDIRFEMISKSLHPIIFGSQVVISIQGIAAKSDFVSLKYIFSLAFCGSLIGALGAETSRSKCSTMRWSLTISSIWGSWRRFISAFWLQTTN